jgi:predicted ester cyclase
MAGGLGRGGARALIRPFHYGAHLQEAAVSTEGNKKVVATFVEVCQNGHDLSAADEMFHPEFVDHRGPDGHPTFPTERPAAGFQEFYGTLLQAFPDATMEIREQIAERDLVVTRKILRGSHVGEIWGLRSTGNTVAWEFIDIFRVKDGKLAEHWTSMDLDGLRSQMQPRD